MSDYPSTTTPIRNAGFKEVCEVNGRTFTRTKGTQQWTEYIPSTSSSNQSLLSLPLYLSLVHQRQGQGEPLHWSLFVSRENQPGYVFQVKGDAEYMSYLPSDGVVNIVQSGSFLNIYHLAAVTEEQQTVVRDVAAAEVPPRAEDRKSVTENCQGWSIRVITKLVGLGLVPTAKLDMARNMLEPV
ncbi:hypothetical protein N7497_009294 [Penicillium chrysogenum]|jgi:hypothetical protein|uniref:Uncharacterized protein n=1 Tax=Penicillium chrysogenum TaxID=5076 RepID=A0ABQ8WJL2_PENCH|nr:hypothetical protein N7524_007796 [Penicillium chrysogenum]KAJ5269954.1 hypothetical protein N7505_005712 [Penicillium chrysogenum]KAJ6147312.1 hypothetical protein N7497_009294 [Penicillium chrysogenum]